MTSSVAGVLLRTACLNHRASRGVDHQVIAGLLGASVEQVLSLQGQDNDDPVDMVQPALTGIVTEESCSLEVP